LCNAALVDSRLKLFGQKNVQLGQVKLT
jgi:hypothetical protein